MISLCCVAWFLLVFTGLGQYGKSEKWQEPDCQGDVKLRMHMMEDRLIWIFMRSVFCREGRYGVIRDYPDKNLCEPSAPLREFFV